jgi:hypothetical protein
MALFGAAVAGLIWLVFGSGSASPVASFQVSSGGQPVVFLYLDNVHIASYLAQLQGGASTTEVLSRQASVTRSASVASNGVGFGGSASQQSTAQLSLTVNDQSRLTSLLGLLQSDGYLHTIDMGARDAAIRREFAEVPDGGFVKLTDCSLSVPGFVQEEELWRAAKGRLSVYNLMVGSGAANMTQEAYNTAVVDRAVAEHKRPPGVVGASTKSISLTKQQLAQARLEMNRLVRRVGTNPSVPLNSCSLRQGYEQYDPHAPDLLMPIRLGEFTANQAALAGRVTLVAKVMLAVRGTNSYVDLAALQQWAGANLWTQGALDDAATVLAPGYVLQPIAIYK